MMTCDPIPWLMAQDDLPAVRARRLLGLYREDDADIISSPDPGRMGSECRTSLPHLQIRFGRNPKCLFR